jgi:hypothetical protein
MPAAELVETAMLPALAVTAPFKVTPPVAVTPMSPCEAVTGPLRPKSAPVKEIPVSDWTEPVKVVVPVTPVSMMFAA